MTEPSCLAAVRESYDTVVAAYLNDGALRQGRGELRDRPKAARSRPRTRACRAGRPGRSPGGS
ncbi:hypothetical protein [Streptomyces orinoci]|uniref:Uncharacterized protein n=1 Tax=Streptomyces orinoci TaxID=67339 RepID=A0ABV3K4U9_STRON|nr:hypothetical protein [Streptomyces orinoci]